MIVAWELFARFKKIERGYESIDCNTLTELVLNYIFYVKGAALLLVFFNFYYYYNYHYQFSSIWAIILYRSNKENAFRFMLQCILSVLCKLFRTSICILVFIINNASHITTTIFYCFRIYWAVFNLKWDQWYYINWHYGKGTSNWFLGYVKGTHVENKLSMIF